MIKKGKSEKIDLICSNPEFNELVKNCSEGFRLLNKISHYKKSVKNQEKQTNKLWASLRLNAKNNGEKIKKIFVLANRKLNEFNLNYGRPNYEFFSNISNKPVTKIKKELFYTCEFCDIVSLVKNECHIITSKSINRNRKYVDTKLGKNIFNIVFFCANCHDITEKKWNKAQKIPDYKKFMNGFKRQRTKDNQKIVLKLKKDLGNFELKYKEINEFIKTIERFKQKFIFIENKKNREFNANEGRKRKESKRNTEQKNKSEKRIKKQHASLLSKAKSEKRKKQLRKIKNNKIKQNTDKYGKISKIISDKYEILWDKNIKPIDKEQNKLENELFKKIDRVLKFMNKKAENTRKT